MNPAESEGLRVNLLQQLRAAQGATLPLPTLANGARLAGFDTSEALVRAALVYLQDKTLVSVVAPLVSPENKRWRINASGMDFLAEAGL